MTKLDRGAISDSINCYVCDETCNSVDKNKSLQKPTDFLYNERPSIKRPTDSDCHLSCNECGGIFECDENVEEKHQSTLNVSCIKGRQNNNETSDVQCFLLEQKKCASQSTNMCLHY